MRAVDTLRFHLSVVTRLKAVPMKWGIRAERAQWAMQRGENRAE